MAAVDALLPQTQCRRCGFPDCRSYALAIARDGTPINRCPPGGRFTIERLASLTGRRPSALDPRCGAEGPRAVACIDEPRCIGCTLCIQACPVDAIIGGAGRMHAVIDAWCTGCELCVEPCPVDCIEMRVSDRRAQDPALWLEVGAGAARARYRARRARLARRRRTARRCSRTTAGGESLERRRIIADAVARVRDRRRAARARSERPDA